MTESNHKSNAGEEERAVESGNNDQQEPTANSPVDSLEDSIKADLFNQLAGLGLSEILQSVSENAAPISDSMPDEEHMTTEESSSSDNATDHLEDIAEDMSALIRRMSKLEKAQQAIIGTLEQMRSDSTQSVRTIAREVDTLRRDLVGDRKHSAATGVFNEVIPMLDRLRTMHSHLNEAEDARMRSQLEGVLETLSASLRRLGCNEFDAQVGSPFDPNCMQCDAYVESSESVVVTESVMPGYLFGEIVMRLASVKVGASPLAASEEQGDHLDE